ncbi:MAG: DNA repair protein RecN [Oscillospiraceae bacterium]|jgi:DNA repair protein RecN (Recombination protein N)|nr:DNA repair protein RecN [Oscillospiraceae bacterium]
MLKRLRIENVAVIERGEIEFSDGLNILTGETGAGKSIVIDALGAIIGSRVGRELVRTGADSAIITGEFELSPVINSWLSENDLGNAEDDTLILNRKVSSDGKSSCRINGIAVSVAQLRDIGGLLVDIHGQNDGQKLLAEANHLAYLDRFAGAEELLSGYRAKYDAYNDAAKRLEALRKMERDKELRIEELHRVIEEIARAGLRVGEEDELLKRRELLKNAGKLTGYIEIAYDALNGGGDALTQLANAEKALIKAGAFSEELQLLADELNSVYIQVDDIAERISDYRYSMEFSPTEQEDIEARLALLQRIERRYGSVEECEERLERSRRELDELEQLDANLSALEKEASGALAECLEYAEKLHTLRAERSAELEKRIETELSALSMPGARFKVELTELDTPDRNGRDEIRFLMSANAGEAVGRISKIASGGELSRIMLALKVVMPGDVGTQIFDEIDSGVSGIAAQRVGSKLCEIAANKQVLCVTHLPQIAAVADEQYLIEKRQESGRTYTSVARLDSDGRAEEVARLMGGENVSASALQAARDMINARRRGT